MTIKQYLEVGFDTVVAYAAHRFFGWIGFGVWVFFVISVFAIKMITAQKTTLNTLLSRLPDRCAFCHREIVDEGGVFDHEGIYHSACSDKPESLEELRREAGAKASEAIHKPQPASDRWK
jgi:hypothetical protein